MDRIFYTLDEAAEICACSKSTIQKAIRAGELQKTKIGKLARIHKDHLEQWSRELAGTPTALDCLPVVNLRSDVVENTVGTQWQRRGKI